MCALFSEGGSYAGKAALDDRELLAVAWTIRNRHDALAKAQAAGDVRHWNYFAGRAAFYKGALEGDPAFRINHPLTYRELLRAYAQITGVDGRLYKQCAKPTTIDSAGACRRIKKCIEIVEGVFAKGSPEDPYKGQGNPDYPGVFFYKKKGNSKPHPGPLLPELTGNDRHFYQGLYKDYEP